MLTAEATADYSEEELTEAYHEIREQQGLPSLRTLFKYCPQVPLPSQVEFLNITCEEALYGGEAGGGKSSALGMAALMYADEPEYNALMLRVNVADFFRSNGLATRMSGWLQGKARWVGERNSFIFPSGARIEFGHLKTRADLERYLSQEYSFIAWEELTTFSLPSDPEEVNYYLWLNRSLRQSTESKILPRVRAATNPGGPGHLFAKRHFLTDELIEQIRTEQPRHPVYSRGRAYLHSYGEDNTHVAMGAYRKRLDKLDSVSRARQKFGDWSIQDNAEISPSWFRYYHRHDDHIRLLAPDKERILCEFPISEGMLFVTCDSAGTSADRAKIQKGNRSSYTAIGVWLQAPARIGKYLICLDVIRKRLSIPELRQSLVETNSKWRPSTILLENEKFGMALSQLLANKLPIRTVSTGGRDKKTRAVPFLDALEAGKIFYPLDQPAWWRPYFEELTHWTGLPTDLSDQLDMSAYAGQRVFMAAEPLWNPLHFGSDYRFSQPPSVEALGIGVAPARIDEDEASAVVCVARSRKQLWIDGAITRMGIEDTLRSIPQVHRDTFPAAMPHKIMVDAAFSAEAKALTPALRELGVTSRISYRQVKEAEAIAKYLDSGIREGLMRYSLSDGGTAIVSRLSTYPESADESAMRGLWLGVHALN